MADQVLSDRYEIQQQLGRNAGRRTLVARDMETQELVVIKILSFSSDFEWNALKLFEREAETLKALSHPAIPRYLDSFELDLPNSKGFALVQTYVEGKSLEEHLQAGRTFTEQEVRQIALDLLEILIYLHGRQPPVIHRDIKPSNILLTNCSESSNGQVYLVDFGSVQTLAAKEGGTMTVVGTYGYMPLEQFGGRAVPASDLYSLGATLITLVTGTHPADLPQKDGRIQFEQATNLSPAFANWLRWMTQPSLDRRLISATEALQALEQRSQRDTHPLVVRKPVGSKVLLTKNSNSLELIIPTPRFHPFLVFFMTPFAIAWFAGIFSWTAQALSGFFPVNLLFALFSLPFWCVGVGMALFILFMLFGRIRLRVNQQRISLTYELFGFLCHIPRPASRHDINKLVYIPKHFAKDSDGDQFEVPSQLIVWAGTHQYKLGGDSFLLTEPEMDWLAHELSDWLGMAITRE